MHATTQRLVSMTNLCHIIVECFYFLFGFSNFNERHQIQCFKYIYSYSTLVFTQTSGELALDAA